MDSKDYTPLVSDEQIYVPFGSIHALRANEVRDIYEARYQQDQATIAALREEVEALKRAGNNMRQRIIHRVPNIDIGTDTDLALYNAIHAWTDALTTKTD